MTISIEYSFTQTQNGICLIIPDFKVPITQSCLFVSDLFIRLTIEYYHLEVNFSDKVDINSIRLTENNGIYYIHLNKLRREVWKTIIFQGTKEDILSRQEASLQRRELDMKQRIHSVQANRYAEERMALRGQMYLEKKERDEITKIKSDEKRSEQKKLYESMRHLECTNSDRDRKKECLLSSRSEHKSRAQPIRQACNIRFSHSPRFFKTPIRESTTAQEQICILKNLGYVKGKKYFNLDVDDTEIEDMVLLKAKGDELYEGKDFLSAINIYSTIIDIDPSNIPAYSNRSAAYLMVDEPYQCIRDCKKICDILKNYNEREKALAPTKKIYLRLSLAYFQVDVLGRSANLEFSFEHFLKGKMEVEGDIIKNHIQCRDLKRKGDIAMKNKNFNSAIEFYTSAIKVGKENTLLSVYVNRASSFTACSKYTESIKDCTFVLETLKRDLSNSMQPFSAIPKHGSGDRRMLVEICITKRAHNHFKVKNWNACVSDLELALMISDKNLCLKSDLSKVKAFI